MEVVQSFCYLGIEFVASGSTHLARKILLDKASKATFPIYSIIKQFNLAVSNSIELFKTFVTPIMLYNSQNLYTLSKHQREAINEGGSNLFEYAINSDLQRRCLRFFKHILGVNRSCPSLAVLGETGEYPIMVQMYTSLLKLWHRMALMDSGSLLKQALELQMSLGESSDWMASVKFLLCKTNLQHLLEDPHSVTTPALARKCKKKLREMFISYWVNGRTGKLNTYIKSNRTLK